VQALLRFAQVGQGKIEKKPAPVETILERALHNLQLSIEEQQAKIMHAPLPVVMGNSVLLLQLFENLIGNALKYSRPEEPPRIVVSAESRDSYWLFRVEDNGEGIAPEYQNQIFEPLKRLHSADIPGTGLGLTLCLRIIERHGGRIWVESQVGQGSTFHFTLPTGEENTNPVSPAGQGDGPRPYEHKV